MTPGIIQIPAEQIVSDRCDYPFQITIIFRMSLPGGLRTLKDERHITNRKRVNVREKRLSVFTFQSKGKTIRVTQMEDLFWICCLCRVLVKISKVFAKLQLPVDWEDREEIVSL